MHAQSNLLCLCSFREAQQASFTLGTPFHICVVFNEGMVTNMILVLQASLGLFEADTVS